MAEPFEELSQLDRLIHEPARLAIATALASCRKADFTFLQRLTGLTRGNLGSHLAKLEAAGVIEIDKAFEGKHPRTSVWLTPQGRAAVEQHWQRLRRLGEQAWGWSPDADVGVDDHDAEADR